MRAFSLIENKTWSDDTNATVKPLEIDSDSNGNLYILGSITKPNNSGPMMGMGEDFLGNTLTVLTSTGTHIRTIEILNSDDGKSYLNSHREHLATSSNGTTLFTNKKAILIDSQSNITTLIDEPLVANQWEYRSTSIASFYDGSFYLQMVEIFSDIARLAFYKKQLLPVGIMLELILQEMVFNLMLVKI